MWTPALTGDDEVQLPFGVIFSKFLASACAFSSFSLYRYKYIHVADTSEPAFLPQRYIHGVLHGRIECLQY